MCSLLDPLRVSSGSVFVMGVIEGTHQTNCCHGSVSMSEDLDTPLRAAVVGVVAYEDG